MQQSIRFIIIVLFFIWLLPLGVFIKPSQEKMACDGKRAVCMCSQMSSKGVRSSLEGFSLKLSSGSQKQEGSSGGAGGSYFLVAQAALNPLIQLSFLNREAFFTYGDPFLRSIEHIPKA